MNPYLEKLKFPDPPEIDLTPYRTGQRSHTRAPKGILGEDLDKILANVGVRIRWVEVFYLNHYADHSIHCDGHELDVKAKLNYVVGGKNSVMTWYECIDDTKIEKRLSKANTIFLGTSNDNVVEVYSTPMQGFYLVNAGMFHNVWNKDDDRFCFSTCIEDVRTGRRLDYPELQSRLKEYCE